MISISESASLSPRIETVKDNLLNYRHKYSTDIYLLQPALVQWILGVLLFLIAICYFYKSISNHFFDIYQFHIDNIPNNIKVDSGVIMNQSVSQSV